MSPFHQERNDVREAVGDHIERMVPNDVSCLTRLYCGHGRQEKRTYTLIEDLSKVRDLASWPDLWAAVIVVSERTVGQTTSQEIRYFLTSFPGTLAELAEAIRGHWGIENQCH